MAIYTSPDWRPIKGGQLGSGTMTIQGQQGFDPYQAAHERWLSGDRNKTQLDAARIGADASMLPARLQQQRFDTVFPWLTSQIGSFMSNPQFATIGGQSPASPEITVGGVLNPQQVQQQVNAMRAHNDQKAQTQMQGNSQDLAGRGFGSNSPLLAALQGQAQANNLATNTAGARDIRLNAAQMNASHLLDTQQAREGQFASRQREDIERRKPYWAYQTSLLGALAGLV